MKNRIAHIHQIRSYLLLWFTQMISGLGSAMTFYALVIWSYTQSGLALQTALLMVRPMSFAAFLQGRSARWSFCAC